MLGNLQGNGEVEGLARSIGRDLDAALGPAHLAHRRAGPDAVRERRAQGLHVTL